MKRIKLDDIKHSAPFKTPAGYFDGLAHKIQEKAIEQQKKRGFALIPAPVKVAIPAFMIALLAVVFWPSSTPAISAEDMLAEVSTQAIIEYLYESEVTIDELIENYEFEELESEEEDSWMEDIDTAELDLLLQDYEITGEYL